MRPEKLEISGLRSYRGRHTINFADRNLIAIIGDTGAGKSSLLEGIYFALYGGCTWHARSPKALIADGGDGLVRAELTFRARGQRWRITRSLSATNYPPAVRKLENLENGTVLTSSADVDAAIEQIVGMNGKTFLRAVVLPQGRFQELLHTSDAERAAALKALLGLGVLEEVRDEASAVLRRVEPQVTDLRMRRTALRGNPRQDLQDALHRIQSVQSTLDLLQQVSDQIDQARERQDTATLRGQQLRQAATALTQQIPAHAEQTYQTLITLSEQISTDRTAIQAQHGHLDGQIREITDQLARADEAGAGIRGNTLAHTTIQTLQHELALLTNDQNASRRFNAELESLNTAVKQRETKQDTLVADLGRAQSNAEVAKKAAQSAEEALDAAHRLVVGARQAAAALTETTAHARQAHEAVGRSAEELDQAWTRVAALDDAHDAAIHHLETARLANAAADAASTSHAGDPCPICDRALPEGFTPPSPTSLTPHERARTRSAQHAKAARQALGTAEATYEQALVRQQQTAQQAAAADTAYQTALAELRAVLPAANLDHSDEQLLHNQRHEQARTRSQSDELDLAVTQLSQDAAAGQAALAEQQASVQQQEKRYAELTAGLTRRRKSIIDRYRALPGTYRTGDASTVDTTTDASTGVTDDAGEEVSQAALPHVLRVALDIAERRRGMLDTLSHEQRQLEGRRRALVDQQIALDRRHNAEVDVPAASLTTRIGQLAENIPAAGQLVGQPTTLPSPQQPGLNAASAWARCVLAAAQATIDACESTAAGHDDQARHAERAISRALASAELADEQQLRAQRDQAAAEKIVAARDRDTAQAQLPMAEDLDRRLADLGPAVDAVRDVYSLLADGKFIRDIVAHRQQTLLALASDLLGSMSRLRFGFAADFLIIDTTTGQPRDTKTLSGGETFLASLALALALVELTARGGAHVEALFLDEGFGTLDANVLAHALDVLAQQAGRGRLVAVISHLRDVALHFEDILLVSSTVAGSQAEWLTQEEVTNLVTRDTTSLLD